MNDREYCKSEALRHADWLIGLAAELDREAETDSVAFHKPLYPSTPGLPPRETLMISPGEDVSRVLRGGLRYGD